MLATESPGVFLQRKACLTLPDANPALSPNAGRQLATPTGTNTYKYSPHTNPVYERVIRSKAGAKPITTFFD
ncbi:MAG: hypothetical protein LUG51_06055 [Tannerellaceae bacterium]|nr:hypothetical protein [Tannerellaceae bacterium]